MQKSVAVAMVLMGLPSLVHGRRFSISNTSYLETSKPHDLEMKSKDADVKLHFQDTEPEIEALPEVSTLLEEDESVDEEAFSSNQSKFDQMTSASTGKDVYCVECTHNTADPDYGMLTVERHNYRDTGLLFFAIPSVSSGKPVKEIFLVDLPHGYRCWELSKKAPGKKSWTEEAKHLVQECSSNPGLCGPAGGELIEKKACENAKKKIQEYKQAFDKSAQHAHEKAAQLKSAAHRFTSSLVMGVLLVIGASASDDR